MQSCFGSGLVVADVCAGAILEPNTVDGLGLLEAVQSAKLGAEKQFAEDRAARNCSPSLYVGTTHFAVQGGQLTI